MAHGIPINGDALRVARLRRRLTQQQVATRVGVSPIQILRIETGQRRPSPDLLDRLAQVFGHDAVHAALTDRGRAIYDPR